MSRRTRGPAEAGFTLVEALVVLTITALVLALTPGALRLGQRAWQASVETQRSSDRTAALHRITSLVSGARTLYERDATGLSRIAFMGETQRFTLVTELAVGPTGGGLYALSLESSGDAGALDVTLAPYRPSAAPVSGGRDGDQGPTARESPPTSGVAGITRTIQRRGQVIRFRYFGADPETGASRWLESWPHRDHLPSLIAIDGIGPSATVISLAMARR